MKERFDLRKTLGAAVLTAAIAGCGSSAIESPKQTNVPNPTPNHTELIVPTPRSTETPTPTKTPELNMEQQAVNAFVDSWLKLLNSEQKKQIATGEDVNYYLKTSVRNFNDWEHNLVTIKNGGTSDSSLIVDWVGGVIYPKSAGSNKYQGEKTQGIMTLEEIHISEAEVGLTPPDTQAGITHVESIELDFKVSYAQNIITPSQDTPFSALANVENWIFQTDPHEYNSHGTPLYNVQIKNMAEVFINGAWEFQGQNRLIENPPKKDDILAYIEKPMPYMGYTLGCQEGGDNPCHIFVENISY